MRSITVLILSIFLLFLGCNAVTDMKDMYAKQGMVQEAIKEKYGLNSRVGWNMHNGVLTQVTVVFSADEVRDRRVAELEAVVKEAVAEAFASTPKILNVQIACKPKTET